MILLARKNLFATNIFFFCIIYIIQKAIQVFCIIEEKACKKCPADKRCDERCVAPTTDDASEATSRLSVEGPMSSSSSTPSSSPPPSPIPPVKGLRLIPVAMRKTMRNFGFGEGHYQIFVEEKQRQHYISKSRLNAAVAEVKLNPN